MSQAKKDMTRFQNGQRCQILMPGIFQWRLVSFVCCAKINGEDRAIVIASRQYGRAGTLHHVDPRDVRKVSFDAAGKPMLGVEQEKAEVAEIVEERDTHNGDAGLASAASAASCSKSSSVRDQMIQIIRSRSAELYGDQAEKYIETYLVGCASIDAEPADRTALQLETCPIGTLSRWSSAMTAGMAQGGVPCR